MKFLKKLTLINSSSGTLSHHHSSDLAYTSTLSSFYWCNLERLIQQLNKYLFSRKNTNSIKSRCNHSNQKNLNAPIAIPGKNASAIGWAALIKTPPAKNCSPGNQTNDHLTGRSILCVGGRSRLYPEYQQLTENCGGNLMTFHGDPNDHMDNLPQLLEKADMIICPIDCVNHQAFFIVKHYCKYSGKPCVLLDRSEANTFCKGISRLITLTTERVSN